MPDPGLGLTGDGGPGRGRRGATVTLRQLGGPSVAPVNVVLLHALPLDGRMWANGMYLDANLMPTL